MVKKVLLVEDDPNYRNSIKAAFRHSKDNYIFNDADSVQKGLEKLEEDEDIRVVALDLDLDGEKGTDLIKRIKDKEKYKFIVLTGKESLLSEAEADKLDIFSYERKADRFPIEKLKFSFEQAFREPTPQIFISYSQKDRLEAEALYMKLKRSGFKPWMTSKDLKPGENWRDDYINAIQSSVYFIFCLSKSTEEKHGVLLGELNDILEEKGARVKKFIIPVLLEECEIPKEMKKYNKIDLYREDYGFYKLRKELAEEL